MTANRIFLLKRDHTLKNGLSFKSGVEFHIVMDVVYMSGFPVPSNVQQQLLSWILDNQSLFHEIYR